MTCDLIRLEEWSGPQQLAYREESHKTTLNLLNLQPRNNRSQLRRTLNAPLCPSLLSIYADSSPTESESAHGMTTRALVGAVLAGIVVVLAIMLLMIWLVVSKRKANRKRLQKRKAPQVPPQPKPCQNFTITRNEAYRVPATSYEEDSAHNPYYIMPQEYTVPTLGKTHSIIQSETLLDSYEYVIPSRI